MGWDKSTDGHSLKWKKRIFRNGALRLKVDSLPYQDGGSLRRKKSHWTSLPLPVNPLVGRTSGASVPHLPKRNYIKNYFAPLKKASHNIPWKFRFGGISDTIRSLVPPYPLQPHKQSSQTPSHERSPNRITSFIVWILRIKPEKGLHRFLLSLPLFFLFSTPIRFSSFDNWSRTSLIQSLQPGKLVLYNFYKLNLVGLPAGQSAPGNVKKNL